MDYLQGQARPGKPHFLAQVAFKAWPWSGLPRFRGHLITKVAVKAWPWPGWPRFSKPDFRGKPGKKTGKPGQARFCRPCRAFGRAPDARVGVPIETVYPDQNHKLLPIYQNLFTPRQWSNPSDSAVVSILWTNTRGWPDRSKEFVVNHFVPLFKRGDEDSVSTQSTATATTSSRTAVEETENLWHIFTRRRRSKQREEEQDTKKTITKDENHLKKQYWQGKT